MVPAFSGPGQDDGRGANEAVVDEGEKEGHVEAPPCMGSHGRPARSWRSDSRIKEATRKGMQRML
jgi:hypothetical protein